MSEGATPQQLHEHGGEDLPRAGIRAELERRLSVVDGRASVCWPVDPGTIGVLRQALPRLAARGVRHVDLELAAYDLDDHVTVVADEAHLAPLLPMIVRDAPDGVSLGFRLTTGRAYVPPPPSLDLSTTDRCSLGCAMCSRRLARRSATGPRRQVLSSKEIRGLIDVAACWGVPKVALTGSGEPFGDPEMPAYVEHANERGLRATITTSGRPVTAELSRWLADHDVSISVSIHGATAACHDGLTGVHGSWEQAWRAVRLLVAERDRAGRRGGLSVGISTVLQRANVRQITAIARQALEAGCNAHGVQPVNLQSGTLEDDRIVRADDPELMSRLWPGEDGLDAIDRTCDELAELAEAHPRLLGTLPARLDLLRGYFRHLDAHTLGLACRAGTSFLGVDCYGDVKPCYRIRWQAGNVRQSDLRTLWNSRTYDAIRRRMGECPLTCMNSCFFRPAMVEP